MSYRDVILADTPVAYWRLGEPSGTNANDEVGTLDGTYRTVGGGSGPTLAQSGLLSNDADTAALWDAAGEEVQIPHNAALNPTEALTIEVWINATAGWGANRIFQKGDDTTFQYRLMHDGGALDMYTAIDGVIGLHFPRPSTGVRHHIVVTYNRINLRAYVDAVQVASAAATGAILTSTLDGAIGNRPGLTNGEFRGVIDEVAFYNVALTATQVGVHYSVGVGGGMVRADMSRFPKSMLQRVA